MTVFGAHAPVLYWTLAALAGGAAASLVLATRRVLPAVAVGAAVGWAVERRLRRTAPP